MTKVRRILVALMICSVTFTMGGFFDADGSGAAAYGAKYAKTGSIEQTAEAEPTGTAEEQDADSGKSDKAADPEKSGGADGKKSSDEASEDASKENTTPAKDSTAPAEESTIPAEETADPAEEQPEAETTETEAEEEADLAQQVIRAELVSEPIYKAGSTAGKPRMTAAYKYAASFWKALTGRKAAAAEHAPEMQVIISGELPKGAKAECRYIDLDGGSIYSEKEMCSLELSFYDRSGKAFVPVTPVTVTIKGDGLKQEIKEGNAPILYAYAKNAKRAEKYRAKYGRKFYAADAVVYTSADVSNKRLQFRPYDDTKKYKKGRDAVRYAKDPAGLSSGKGEVSFVYDYSSGAGAAGGSGSDTAGASASDAAAASTGDSSYDTVNNAVRKSVSDTGKLHLILSSQMKKRTISAEAGNNTVEVTAPVADDVTVEATELKSKSKDYSKYVKQAAQTMNMKASDFTFARVLDIKPIDPATGEEFQPDGKVKVSVNLADEKIGKNEEVAVLHFTDAAASDAAKAGAVSDTAKAGATSGTSGANSDTAKAGANSGTAGATSGSDSNTTTAKGSSNTTSGTASATDPSATTPEVVESKVNDQTVEFETDGFSVFVLVGYTVDFHWGEYTYNLAGGSEIFLSELLPILAENGTKAAAGETEENNSASQTEQLKKIAKDMSLVKSVTFSDPKLVKVEPIEVVDDQELIEDDNSEKLIETKHTDWLLTSLKPFETEETLTIALKNGETIVIRVTDIRYGDNDGENVTKGTGRHVTADGVTYLLSNAGTGNGTARVTGMTAGAVIHDVIVYNNHDYTVENVREAAGTLTGNKNTMDWDVIKKIATYSFELPDLVLSPEEDPTGGDSSYKAGENNGTDINKVWKKAEYNAETNSIDYTIKYFQSMKKDVPLDFIFIYDDSASMYSGNRTSGGITLCEAQTTRVLIQAAAKALFSKGASEGYNIKVYLGGASTGDTRMSQPLSSYEEVADYLSTYNTGTTRHATGVSNALSLAKTSKNAGRNPVVIYLSDFHQPGTLGTAGVNSATALHALAPVYALGTDTGYRFTTNNATKNIPSGTSYYRTMNDIKGGVQELENIIHDAIGYYMKDELKVTDALSEPLKGQTPTNAASGDKGTVSPSTGRVSWSLGNQDPYLGAGKVYTETFTVGLDENKVYSGELPTNADVTVKQGNKEVNRIPGTNSPITQKGVGFVLGKMNKDGSHSDVKLDGVKFTLQKEGGSAKEYTSNGNGAFTVPFSDCDFAPGDTYTLTQDQTTTAALTGDKEVTIANPMTWTLTVNSDYTITAAKAGADTDVTISGGKFNLWNREFTEPPLTKVIVRKVWDSEVPSDPELRQPINFTVYGVKADNTKVALPAYNQENREGADQVTKLTSSGSYTYKDSSGNTQTVNSTSNEWVLAVWVPKYIESQNDIVSYTVGEGALPEMPSSSDPIGIIGEWDSPAIDATGTSQEYEAGEPTYTEITGDMNTYVRIKTKSGGPSFTFNSVLVDFTYGTGLTGQFRLSLNNTITTQNGKEYTFYGFKSPSSWEDRTITRLSFDNGSTYAYDGDYSTSLLELGSPKGGKPYETFYFGFFQDDGRHGNHNSAIHTQVNSSASKIFITNSAPAVQVDVPVLKITNSITPYKVLTINSLFKDSSLNGAATGRIKAVGYEIVDENGKVIAEPEVQVKDQTPLDPNERKKTGGDVKVYVPKDKEYTVKQTYYKLESTGVAGAVGGETTVDADQSGKFSAFDTAPAFGTGSDSSKCAVSGASASMKGQAASDGTVTFTNDRVKLPVDVKATWDPDLVEVNAPDDNARVEAEGIPYEFSWGEGSGDKLTGQTVKKADTDVDGAPWTRYYDTADLATAVPSYTIEGDKTRCVITSETEPHPYYDTEVVRQETAAGLVFTIRNTVKQGEITIAKDWDIEQFEESGATETDPPVMGPKQPESVTVQVKKVGSEQTEEVMYFNGEHHQVSSSAEGAVKDLVLNRANGWKVTATGLDVGQKYIVEETEIADQAADQTAFAQEYVVEVASATGMEASDPKADKAVIEPLTLDDTIVNISNRLHPIARVNKSPIKEDGEITGWDPDGWVYFEYLITQSGKTGAFNYAGSLAGDVMIETLKEGNNGSTDDTKFEGDSVGRYTLGTMTTFSNTKKVNITLRTAPGLGFTSTIHRGFNNSDGMIKINNANVSFVTEDITFDGMPGETQRTGRAIYVGAGGLTVKDGSTFRNFSTPDSGGAIYTTQVKSTRIQGSEPSAILFENCRTTGNTGDYYGGGAIEYYSGAGVAHVEGATFIDCYTPAAGGAIYTRTASGQNYKLFVTNCVFDGHEDLDRIAADKVNAKWGGAIYLWDGWFSMTNCSFTDCTASVEGGAVCDQAGTGDKIELISNCYFNGHDTLPEDTVNAPNGGAMALTNVGNGIDAIRDLTVKNYTVSNGNGGGINITNAVRAVGGTFTITNCKTTKGSGGGIYFNTTASLEDNVRFIIDNCHAGGNGGGVCFAGGFGKNMTIKESVFTDCSSGGNGGCVWAKNTSGTYTTKFESCTFNGHVDDLSITTPNAANGGGVYIDDGHLEFVDCTLTNLTAKTKGGAVYTAAGGGDSVIMTRCTINGNDGKLTKDGVTVINAVQGGGVYAVVTNGITLEDVTFNNCQASNGGGGLYTDSPIKETSGDVGFTDCYTTGGNGGGAYIGGTVSLGKSGATGNTVTFKGCHTDSTSTANGGGGAWFKNTPTLQSGTDLTFDSCYSASYGGGAWFNAATTLSNVSVSFKNCYAEKRGGGAYFANSAMLNNTVSFEKCHTDTTSDGGGGAYFANSATLNGTVSFEDCYTKANGGAMYLAVGGALTNVRVDGHKNLAAAMTNAVKGGAFYLPNDKAVTLHGGEYKNCSASDANGGAVNVGGTKSVLNFEADVVVYNNPQTAAEGVQQKNVVLDCDANTVIKTTGTALSPDAHIGVYVPDGTSLYNKHGKITLQFGTKNTSNANLDRFTNDRDETLFGAEHLDTGIYWGKYICKVVDTDTDKAEHLFTTLMGAVKYARTNRTKAFADGFCTVQMLVDYTVPLYDVVTLNTANDKFVFTTAKTKSEAEEAGEEYYFTDTLENKTEADKGISILSRGWNGGSTKAQSLFYVTNGSATLSTTKLIMDGKNGNTQQTGRAICINSGNLSVSTGSVFRNFYINGGTSSEPGDGGAIYIPSTGTSVIDEASFIDCHTESSTGGSIYFYVSGKTLTVSNCVFDGHEALADNTKNATNGGAIYVNDGRLNVSGSTFKDLWTSGAGGAIHMNGGGSDWLEISDCSIDGHDSLDSSKQNATQGGGVRINADSRIALKNLSISDCWTNGDGGGLYSEDTITSTEGNVNFTDCYTTSGNGGALYLNAGGTLTNVSVNGHSGGADGLPTGTVNAKLGSAIYSNGNLTIRQEGTGNSEIKNCSASDANGGAVNVATGKTMTFEGSVVIYGNTGTGTLAAQQKNVVLQNPVSNDYNRTINTTATGLGAGAHIGVYVTGTMTGSQSEPYKNHGQFEQNFGTWPAGGSTEHFDAFTNDRNGLYGENSSTANKIRWTSYLCKLTDSDGKLLYTDDEHKNAAVYRTFAVAFNALKGVGPNGTGEVKLYKYDGTEYEYTAANDIHVELLKNYRQPESDAATNTANRSVTLKTAANTQGGNKSTDDIYIYNKGKDAGVDDNYATVKRGYTGKSMFTMNSIDGELTVTGVILDGNKDTVDPASDADPKAKYASTGNGGIIKVSSGTLNIREDSTFRNSVTSGNGGAVYVAKDAKMTMNTGTITGNKAANGAGIYLEEGSELQLSGSPGFGGTDAQNDGNHLTADGSPRQDIYIDGYLGTKGGSGDDKGDPKLAGSLRITGALDLAKGSIWVGAEQQENEENNHWDSLKQFAMFADSLMKEDGNVNLSDTDLAKTVAAFRNASLTEYYGVTGENLQCIYWDGVKGSRRVILRKVASGSYKPLPDAQFQIRKGSKEGPYVTIKDREGNDQYTFISSPSGAFFVGNLDYGVYYVEEKVPPTEDGYEDNKDKFFTVTVNEKGVGYLDDEQNLQKDVTQ